ncbi:unnamed protein product [Nippostrongylus brasiliensis]|uniref:Uncharacterized protein n=1 Tax=Nippostrongylus brasiliensis TaxID=27835 RepID=A0A0N4XZ80_NIPBR|nr:unnamed protein product [Nippostrongylus brasiliensis]
MLFILLPLFFFITAYAKLTCTECEFHNTPVGRTNCSKTCQGDVCHIVVNKFFNGTIIAGCINLYKDDTFKEAPSACYRGEYRVYCACNTTDKCNYPTSPISNFKFTDKMILEGYQLTPMIEGHGEAPPTLKPIIDAQVTTQSPETQGNDEAGVKPNEHYAPLPNGVSIDELASTTTLTSTTVEAAKKKISSNEDSDMKTKQVATHDDTLTSLAVLRTTETPKHLKPSIEKARTRTWRREGDVGIPTERYGRTKLGTKINNYLPVAMIVTSIAITLFFIS